MKKIAILTALIICGYFVSISRADAQNNAATTTKSETTTISKTETPKRIRMLFQKMRKCSHLNKIKLRYSLRQQPLKRLIKALKQQQRASKQNSFQIRVL